MHAWRETCKKAVCTGTLRTMRTRQHATTRCSTASTMMSASGEWDVNLKDRIRWLDRKRRRTTNGVWSSRISAQDATARSLDRRSWLITKELKNMHCDRPNPPPSTRSLADMGTGTIHFRLPRGVPLPAGLSCTIVSFEPRARTHWHIHPLGQRLFVTAGCGWMQCEG